MGILTTDLRDLGYEPTDRESPFDDDGELWTNSYELVCDETGFVIRKDGSPDGIEDQEREEYEYRISGNVKLVGGHASSYEWGSTDDGSFTYDWAETKTQ